MKITREADYALRIVAMLARENKQIEAKTISAECQIPYRFTLKILRKIVQSGIIKSFRGVNGGYRLDKEPSEVTFKEVIETIDGKVAINRCQVDGEQCENDSVCKIKHQLDRVQDIVAKELGNITFDSVI